jgi:hypothetical protein
MKKLFLIVLLPVLFLITGCETDDWVAPPPHEVDTVDKFLGRFSMTPGIYYSVGSWSESLDIHPNDSASRYTNLGGCRAYRKSSGQKDYAWDPREVLLHKGWGVMEGLDSSKFRAGDILIQTNEYRVTLAGIVEGNPNMYGQMGYDFNFCVEIIIDRDGNNGYNIPHTYSIGDLNFMFKSHQIKGSVEIHDSEILRGPSWEDSTTMSKFYYHEKEAEFNITFNNKPINEVVYVGNTLLINNIMDIAVYRNPKDGQYVVIASEPKDDNPHKPGINGNIVTKTNTGGE